MQSMDSMLTGMGLLNPCINKDYLLIKSSKYRILYINDTCMLKNWLRNTV
jgi:hypothetical protein